MAAETFESPEALFITASRTVNARVISDFCPGAR